MKNIRLLAFFLLFAGVFVVMHPGYAKPMLNWLKITVVDNKGNRVENAEVKLYNNKEDYEAGENPVDSIQKTDEKGKVTYNNLEPDSTYYVEVEKGDLNNYMGGEKIADIKNMRVNKITVVIQ